MDWHEYQVNQSLRHANEHRNNNTLRTRDLSCRICYPVNEETTDEKFKNFWEWYQGITSAERFSANAESVFEELMGKNMENIIEGRENNSKENRPEKKETPKKTRPREISPKAEGSRINKKEILEIEEKLRGFEELKDNDVEIWEEKSIEELFSKEKKEKLERDFELRRLKRTKKAESIDELESIKSEENPYSSGKLSPIEKIEEYFKSSKSSSGVVTPLIGEAIKNEGIKELHRKIIKEKYNKLKENYGEGIDNELMKRKESYNEQIKKIIKDFENKESKEELTEEEEKQLDSLRKAEDCEEREFLLENLTVEQMYEEYFRENEEDNRKKDDEEFFNERYNEKKRKYDKIKELMGDEIDEELIKAKERLHENITQRIEYFEEKKMLTDREIQELEDLKRSDKLDEEELYVEEYVINEIYKELLEKEKEKQEDDIDIKGKGRETKKTSKLELERNEEHTVDTVNELGKFLEDALKEIEEKEKEKKFGLDNEEVRTWAENVEEENAFEEKIPEEIFEKDDENVINTTEILSSSAESSSESDKESEIFEIPEEFELYFGNQDLNLENLFEENLEENFEMALEYGIKLRTFEGRIDENVEDWIIEFEGIADFNNWVDANAVDSARFKAAIAHLRGDALDFYREKRQGNNALRWNTGVAADSVHNFRNELIKKFSSQERKEQWQLELYQVNQQTGESVEAYAQRFKKAAKKVRNTIPEVGIAMAFMQGLLPIIRNLAIFAGKRNTLNKAIESAKTGEISAMGQAQQLIPEQTFTGGMNNRIYQDMGKNKDKDAMEELMGKFKELEIKLLNQGRNNYRRNDNYNRNRNDNIECYNCGERGHIRPDCPNNRETGNNNRAYNNNNETYRNNNRNNNGKNYENINRDNRNRRINNNREINYFESLNFNRTTLEEGNVFDTEYSSEEDNNENEKGIFMTTRSGRKVNSESQ